MSKKEDDEKEKIRKLRNGKRGRVRKRRRSTKTFKNKRRRKRNKRKRKRSEFGAKEVISSLPICLQSPVKF